MEHAETTGKKYDFNIVRKFTLSRLDADGNRHTETVDYGDAYQYPSASTTTRTFTVEPAAAQERIADELGQDAAASGPGFSDEDDCPERRVYEYNACITRQFAIYAAERAADAIRESISWMPADAESDDESADDSDEPTGCCSCDAPSARIEPYPNVCAGCASTCVAECMTCAFGGLVDTIRFAQNAGQTELARKVLQQRYAEAMYLLKPPFEPHYGGCSNDHCPQGREPDYIDNPDGLCSFCVRGDSE